jgi:YD repeat-containing protein
MMDGSEMTSYLYDNTGELTTLTFPQDTLTYSYDNAGQLTTRASAGSTVAYDTNTLSIPFLLRVLPSVRISV